jgi:hypothetical protein
MGALTVAGGPGAGGAGEERARRGDRSFRIATCSFLTQAVVSTCIIHAASARKPVLEMYWKTVLRNVSLAHQLPSSRVLRTCNTRDAEWPRLPVTHSCCMHWLCQSTREKTSKAKLDEEARQIGQQAPAMANCCDKMCFGQR